jgi:hypothetical protein
MRTEIRSVLNVGIHFLQTARFDKTVPQRNKRQNLFTDTPPSRHLIQRPPGIAKAEKLLGWKRSADQGREDALF